jgi:hypothetical protein
LLLSRDRRERCFPKEELFCDRNELIEKALDALDGQATAAAPETATGAVVLAALQARPYPDIDLIPPRVRLTNVRDVAL